MGAYASVKELLHKDSGMKLAIKIYDKFKLLDVQRKKNVAREIRILKHLKHPGFITLYDAIDTSK